MSAHTATNTEHMRSEVHIAAGWTRGLGKVFRRVAIFRVDGTTAKVTSVVGMGPPPLGAGLSLLDETPLRWCVAAASPIVGAGEAPGGSLIARALGLSPPRAYAVIPLATNGKMTALAYVDQASEPLPLTAASELFAFCGKILTTNTAQPAPGPLRSHLSSTSARPRNRRFRAPPMLRAPHHDDQESTREQTAVVEPADSDIAVVIADELQLGHVEIDLPVAAALEDCTSEGLRIDEQYRDIVVTPDGIVSANLERPRRRRMQRGQVIALGSALLFGAALFAWSFSPVGGNTKLVQIPREASVAEIAAHLEERGVIRSAAAFRLLARIAGVDRSLRAGTYRLPEGGWAWTILSALHQGQVEMKSVTIPEGLSLVEVANLLDKEGLTKAGELLRAAYDPELLARFDIPARNIEGYLFPET